jgi:hypothetical protein
MRTTLRIIGAGCLAASVIGSGAIGEAAVAGAVTRTPYGPVTTVVEVTDLCPFPVTVSGTQTGYLIDQSLQSGGEQLIFHGTQTDVFTANGNTLTGLPYTGTIKLTTDADGNPVRFASEGVIEHVPLPGGGEFFAAGRIDWMLHLDAFTLVNPDYGHVDNVGKLCAALA